MSSKLEYVDLSGLRLDGRRPHELRKMNARLGVLNKPNGSSLLEQGNTRILVSVYGPRECSSKAKELHDRASVSCECTMAPYSNSGERKKRSKTDRATTELSTMLRQTFESLLFTNIFPRSQIDIYVEVLQADGGIKPAALNAVTLALIDAGLPMRDFLCSCNAGWIDGHALADLNHLEDSARGPELCVAYMPNCDQVVTCNLDPKLKLEVLGQVMDCALQGARQVYQILQASVLEHASTLAASRGHMTT
jgi:exosome complex component RRP41